MAMIRILLADDHNIVRSGIKGILASRYESVEIDEAANGLEIAEYAKTGLHDLLLLDINMPDTDFLSLIPWIKLVDPGCKVLVISSYPPKLYGVASIRCGAYGYLCKTAPNEEILKAVEFILNGRRYISQELADLMVDQTQGVTETNPIDHLSVREIEISRLLLQGFSLPDIGRRLHLGYTTVVTYKNRIFNKLQIDNVLALDRTLKNYGFNM
jgi:two-component system invasion response regulator UvrY